MVSAPSPHRRLEYPGLLAKLLARVRPEFRVEVYLADPDDPVLGRRPCAVPDCDRSRKAERAVLGSCSALARPGPPGDGRVPRRPGAHAERAPGSDALLGVWMPLRQ